MQHVEQVSSGKLVCTSRKEAFHPNPLVYEYFGLGLMNSLVPVPLGTETNDPVETKG
jgi:hypothetical protein